VGTRRTAPVGRAASEEVAEYCSRHNISFDWMLGGCLKGLKKMTDERRGQEAAASLSTARFLAKYAGLTPEHKAIVTAEIHRILAERNQ